jgi:O-succinylbenzoate synthase
MNMSDNREDKKKIYIWHYRMKTKARLNAKSTRREVEGALVRIGGGFACLQPWVELGDPSLEKCLADLIGARHWPMVRRAVRCAQFDEVAREHGDSLFEDMEIPASHATLAKRNAEQIQNAAERGFTIVKLKCGINPEAESGFVAEMSAAFPSLRWRLDFNETGTAAHVAAFVEALPQDVRRKIDFIEDPCPFSTASWAELYKKTRICLALDRESGPNQSGAQVMIIKPALDEPLLLGEAAAACGQRLVVTSYMDHPLGQCFAAWEAARLALTLPGCVDVCGLQTHHLFEEYLFSEQLGEWSPTFRPPEGTGLGFDELLGVLPWKRIG